MNDHDSTAQGCAVPIDKLVRGVPDYWVVGRLCSVADVIVSNVDKKVDEGERSVRLCNYVDVYNNDFIKPDLAFMLGTASDVEVERFGLRLGDVVITKDSEVWTDIGVPALVVETADDLVCGYHLALLRPNPKQIAGRFLFWALQSLPVAYQLHVRANGVTRFGLTIDAIRSARLPTPPLSEQAAIARFLDHADRRIQRYIRAKEKLVALLEEQKQAVIHQAVTGQIDVRTGVAYPSYREYPTHWMSKLPSHWDVVRLKRHAACSSGGSIAPSEFSTDLNPSEPLFDVPVVGGNGVMGLCGKSNIGSNVLAIGRVGALCGNVHLVSPPAWITDNALVLRPNNGMFELRYLAKALELRNLNDLANQSAQPLITGSQVRNQQIPCPPQAEQRAIVHYLDRLNGSIDAAARAAQSHCELIRVYRARLVADVVTGKLDVREAAANLPEVDALASDGLHDGDDVPDGGPARTALAAGSFAGIEA